MGVHPCGAAAKQVSAIRGVQLCAGERAYGNPRMLRLRARGLAAIELTDIKPTSANA
jgi:hypothetical protein